MDSMKQLSDQIRDAVESCGLSRYRIWKETGIAEPSLSRFVQGKGGLSLESLDLLGDLLRLKVEMQGPRRSILAKMKRN